MPTAELVRKLNREVTSLRSEMRQVRGLIWGLVPQDDEGPYKKSFVRKVLHRMQNTEESKYTFTTPEAFMKQINGNKRHKV